MLVLSRKKGQSIMVGDDIEITIVDIQGDQVRLGISAPRNVAVHRKEVYTDIQEENKKAAKSIEADVEQLSKHLIINKRNNK